ncbi:FAD-dependent thymidylate synthase [Mesoaciditoga sp.]
MKKKIEVLDKGFVELIDVFGGDKAAARAARISYMSKSDPQGDKRLIELLMTNGHESPFEHIVFTFQIKAPIFVARQWFRHRIGSFMERSGRYTKFDEEFYVPKKSRANGLEEAMREQMQSAFKTYKELLENGVKKEVARMVLPMSLYTQWYWTVNARSLMNFLNLRADKHAQYEIQQYALTVAIFFKETCPWTYDAFLRKYYKGDLLEV